MDFDRFSILQRFPVLVFEIGVRFARKMRSKFGRNLKNVIVVVVAWGARYFGGRAIL